MVTVIRNDYTSRYCEFAVDTEDEIDILPTYTQPGQQYLNTIKSCCNGSIAYISGAAMKVFVLNGEDDEWQEIE